LNLAGAIYITASDGFDGHIGGDGIYDLRHGFEVESLLKVKCGFILDLA
jgi:hypothetical protein